jgi:hypothetical protein
MAFSHANLRISAIMEYFDQTLRIRSEYMPTRHEMLLCSSVPNINTRYSVADLLSSSALRRALSRKARGYELFPAPRPFKISGASIHKMGY